MNSTDFTNTALDYDNPPESLPACPTLEQLCASSDTCFSDGNGSYVSHYSDVLLGQPASGKRPFFIGIRNDGKLIADIDLAHPPHRVLYPLIQTTDLACHTWSQSINQQIYIERGFSLLYPWIGNYQHYLAEVYPRLAFYLQLLHCEPELPLLLQADLPEFILESLAFLGINRHVMLRRDRSYRVQKMYVASAPAIDFVSLTGSFFEFYRSLRQKIAVKPGLPERIYISRRNRNFGDGRDRRLVNEEQVIDIFSKRGFCEIQLESLPFDQKLALFHSASVIAGPAGAGLFTSVVARPEAKFIPILHPLLQNEWYKMALREGPGVIYPISCGELIQPAPDQNVNVPWSVNTALLEQELDRVL